MNKSSYVAICGEHVLPEPFINHQEINHVPDWYVMDCVCVCACVSYRLMCFQIIHCFIHESDQIKLSELTHCFDGDRLGG